MLRAGPPSKPEKHHRVNTFFTYLDKVYVLAGIENRFSGNDQDALCALGEVTKSDSPASDSFDLVADYYNFDKDQRLFNRFKKIHVEKSIKTAAEVIDVLHENTLYEIALEFFSSCLVESSFSGLRRLKT